ncbi:peptidase inhibitor i9 [Ceratobasidium sp. AG-Ba]|nr:peptidase inhibitor i9 [Ceratobasidium sp. AG-Ba]QRW12679.1 hypothetical protein RhiLY_11678 [Ceratobasidium sp. AG-Ba]
MKVMLKKSTDWEAHMGWIKALASTREELCEIQHEFRGLEQYSAKLSGEVLQDVAWCLEVEGISQNYRRKAKLRVGQK